MFHDGQLPSYAPDRISLARQSYIEREMIFLIQSADPTAFEIGVRVRHNRPYVPIPQGKMDVSAEVREAVDFVMFGSMLDAGSLSTPETTETGISYYHVDEFVGRLNNLQRIFIVAHTKTDILHLSLTKDDHHIAIFHQRSARRMREWGKERRPVKGYSYERGDFRDISITVPLTQG